MPVATMLAIAASFWAQHGYTVPPVSWQWGIPASVAADPGYTVEAFQSARVIYIDRKWWDGAERWRKCEVLIHEDGHTLGFGHADRSVMSAYDDVYGGHRTVPGICKQWKGKP